MKIKKYKQIRAIIVIYVSMLVAFSTSQDNWILATFAVITGMLFLLLAKSKTKIITDEREISIREKAAQITYSIFTPTIGLGAFILSIPSYSKLKVFSHGDFTYLQSLGTIFSYLTLFILLLYSISYYYLNKTYGGNNEE